MRVETAVAVAPTQLSVHCYHQATANCWMLRKLFTRLFIVCYTTIFFAIGFRVLNMHVHTVHMVHI